MGLEASSLPAPQAPHVADPEVISESSGRPLGLARGGRVERRLDDLLDERGGNGGDGTVAGTVLTDPLDSEDGEPFAL
jgi:hypothetical protein